MKVGVLDIAAVALAIYLAVPAQAETAQPAPLPRLAPEVVSSNRGQPTVTAVQPQAPAQTVRRGIIEGSLGYPGEFVPPLKICAENLVNRIQYCTGVILEDAKYQHGVGYKLEVPSGHYRVFATDTQKSAYFSQAVKCGLKINCQNHEPISVIVTAGQAIAGIDPIDWYSPSAYGLPVD
jgi:hypothetical protein